MIERLRTIFPETGSYDATGQSAILATDGTLWVSGSSGGGAGGLFFTAGTNENPEQMTQFAGQKLLQAVTLAEHTKSGETDRGISVVLENGELWVTTEVAH